MVVAATAELAWWVETAEGSVRGFGYRLRQTTSIILIGFALLLLPFLLAVQALLILVNVLLIETLFLLHSSEIRAFHSLMVEDPVRPASLRTVVAECSQRAEQIRDLYEKDLQNRTSSWPYRTMVPTRISTQLDCIVANYEDVLEAVQIGFDPKWNSKITSRIEALP